MSIPVPVRPLVVQDRARGWKRRELGQWPVGML